MQQYRAIQFTRCRLVWLAGLVLSVLASIADAAESAVTPQHPLYLKHCAMCHEGGIPRAPHSVTFALSGPASVYRAMATGPMVAQAASLTDTEKRELAEFLGASKLADAVTLEANCPADQTNIADGDSTTRNWGMSPGNWRFAEGNGAIRRDNVTRLKLKWAFGIPGVSQARSQPTYANGTLFTGTQTGSVYALDLETGCVRWRYDAGAEVRNAPVLAGFDGAGPQRVYFGDLDGRVHALDGQTGKRLWVTVVDPHPSAVITGTPQLFEDRLIVPISASEWASAADPAYGCCTFQGGVAALSTATGDLL